MKKFLLVIAGVCGLNVLFAAPPKGWMIDYDAALAKAKTEKKFVYVLFTGSDWCPWCIRLRKDVLEKARFRKLAQEKMILVYCDFPQKNAPPAAQLAKQQKWLRELKCDGGVPFAVIVKSDGRIAGNIGGYLPLDAYIDKLESIMK